MKLHLENLEGGMARFSSVVVAEARHQNASWPMVTIPGFEIIGESVRAQTGLEIIVLCPLVTVDTVYLWQEYSVAHAREWLAESRRASLASAARAAAAGHSSSLVATDYVEGNPSSTILDLTTTLAQMSAGVTPGVELSVVRSPSGPYIPIWYAVLSSWRSVYFLPSLTSLLRQDANTDSILS
jgi:hypothetical protein